MAAWFIFPVVILAYAAWSRLDVIRYTWNGHRGTVDTDLFCLIGTGWLIAGYFLFNGCLNEHWTVGGSTCECWLVGGGTIILGVIMTAVLLLAPKGSLLDG